MTIVSSLGFLGVLTQVLEILENLAFILSSLTHPPISILESPCTV